MNPTYSVVIPLYNEEESLRELHRQLIDALTPLGTFELLFIDDGSTDRSFSVLQELFRLDNRVRVFRLRKNSGKSSALTVGFRNVRGSIVIMMDADLQDDPAEIPKLVQHLSAKNIDMVIGWKQHRHDPWTKTLPSKFFNAVVSHSFHLRLHDMNTGLKVMRRAVADELDLYGEQHRFLCVMASLKGFRIDEVAVTHRARKFGTSKYGWKRTLHGMFDLLTVGFLSRFANRPLHLFGSLGALLTLIGLGTGAYLSVLHFAGQSIGERPLLIFSVLCVIAGLQMLFTGLLAELIVSRTGHRHTPLRDVLDHAERE